MYVCMYVGGGKGGRLMYETELATLRTVLLKNSIDIIVWGFHCPIHGKMYTVHDAMYLDYCVPMHAYWMW